MRASVCLHANRCGNQWQCTRPKIARIRSTSQTLSIKPVLCVCVCVCPRVLKTCFDALPYSQARTCATAATQTVPSPPALPPTMSRVTTLKSPTTRPLWHRTAAAANAASHHGAHKHTRPRPSKAPASTITDTATAATGSWSSRSWCTTLAKTSLITSICRGVASARPFCKIFWWHSLGGQVHYTRTMMSQCKVGATTLTCPTSKTLVAMRHLWKIWCARPAGHLRFLALTLAGLWWRALTPRALAS